MLRSRNGGAPTKPGAFSAAPQRSTCLPSFNAIRAMIPADERHKSLMYSAHELRNLACNCRWLARQTEAEQVGIFLIQLADDFDRKASGLELEQEPIGSGRY